jgi:hypothetical protein
MLSAILLSPLAAASLSRQWATFALYRSVSTFPQTLSDWPVIALPGSEHKYNAMAAT